MIAVFGPKVFEVTSKKVNTFDDLQYDTSLNTEDQAADGKKPSTTIKDLGLDNLSFQVKLSAFQGVNPDKEMRSWRDLKNAMKPYPFVLGGKPFGSKWLLVGVSMSETFYNHKGQLLSCQLALKFKEMDKLAPKSGSTSPGVKKKKDLTKVSSANIKPSLGDYGGFKND